MSKFPSNFLEIAIFLIPILSEYFTKLRCPITQSDFPTINIAYFNTITPILQIFIGYAWFIARSKASSHNIWNFPEKLLVDILFICLVVLFNTWYTQFSCKMILKYPPRYLYAPIALIIVTLLIIFVSSRRTAMTSILLMPFFVWLLTSLYNQYNASRVPVNNKMKIKV